MAIYFNVYVFPALAFLFIVGDKKYRTLKSGCDCCYTAQLNRVHGFFEICHAHLTSDSFYNNFLAGEAADIAAENDNFIQIQNSRLMMRIIGNNLDLDFISPRT